MDPLYFSHLNPTLNPPTQYPKLNLTSRPKININPTKPRYIYPWSKAQSTLSPPLLPAIQNLHLIAISLQYSTSPLPQKPPYHLLQEAFT